MQMSVCGKTVSSVIKSESIPNFELSKLALILRREHHKSGIDLMDKAKSFNCRNGLYSESKKSSWFLMFCEILSCSGI